MFQLSRVSISLLIDTLLITAEFKLRVNDRISVLETGEHFYIKMLAPGEKVPGEDVLPL